MKQDDIHNVVALLKKEVRKWDQPIVTKVANRTRDPFIILISTVLSTRTKDEITSLASERLFRLARTPQQMLRLREKDIARAIYPVGFYKTKAKHLLYLCRDLVEKNSSRVPDNLEDLLTLSGVGRKVANLVITLGYGKKGICVDTPEEEAAGEILDNLQRPPRYLRPEHLPPYFSFLFPLRD
jgi:endonuclease-3